MEPDQSYRKEAPPPAPAPRPPAYKLLWIGFRFVAAPIFLGLGVLVLGIAWITVAGFLIDGLIHFLWRPHEAGQLCMWPVGPWDIFSFVAVPVSALVLLYLVGSDVYDGRLK